VEHGTSFLALGPNASSARVGQGLSSPAKWLKLGRKRERVAAEMVGARAHVAKRILLGEVAIILELDKLLKLCDGETIMNR